MSPRQFDEKTKTWEKEFFKKKELKNKTKKESQKKKNKKRETIFQDTEKTWKINVKICPTKKGNRQNRVFWKQKKTEKESFAEVYKDSKYAKKAIDTEKQRDNQRTRKFQMAEKGERTEKTRRDNK